MKSAPALPHELHWGRRILLVGGSEFRQGLRSSVLRGHGLQVEMAAMLAEGPSLLKSRTFDWVLLDAHSELPGAVMDFCERVARAVPGQLIAFLNRTTCLRIAQMAGRSPC